MVGGRSEHHHGKPDPRMRGIAMKWAYLRPVDRNLLVERSVMHAIDQEAPLARAG
jgi:hypothetical protein